MKILDSTNIWSASDGRWFGDARNEDVQLDLQPAVRGMRAWRLLHQLGIKRIRWGYFYTVLARANECGELAFRAIILPNKKRMELISA